MKTRLKRLGMNDNILVKTIITADTDSVDEANMKHLHEGNIDAYIPR